MNHDDNRDDVDLEPEAGGEDEVYFDGEGEEENMQSRLKRLREKLKRVEKEKEENLTGWQRSKADFVNLKKREAVVRDKVRTETVEDVVSRIFPLLDSFEGAFSSESWERGDESFKRGVESIHKQLLSVLRDIGVEEVGKVGEAFDPRVHTSVSSQPTDKEDEDHTIAEVLQKGYVYGERVIRSPKVVVFHCQK